LMKCPFLASAALQFNESDGKVIGFEDLGQCDRSPKFADKALVFMVRGIKKKFKQPVKHEQYNSCQHYPRSDKSCTINWPYCHLYHM